MAWTTAPAMYFRDPSGTLWELYCESGFSEAVRRGVSAGGDYIPDVTAIQLRYLEGSGEVSN